MRIRVHGWRSIVHMRYRWSVYRGAERFGSYFSWKEAMAVACGLAVGR